MARFQEDTREEEREQINRSGDFGVSGELDISAGDLLLPPPEVGQGTDRQRRRRNETNRRQGIIDEELLEKLGKGLKDVEDAIQNGLDLDFGDLSSEELLAVIAQNSVNSLMLQNVMMEQMLAQVVVLNDIASAVEPTSNITVSGTNSIATGGETEPVIPDGDQTETDGDLLIIRAAPGNKDPIYFGDDGTTPGDGFVLNQGEWKVMDMDLSEQMLWMSAENSGNEVQLLGLE